MKSMLGKVFTSVTDLSDEIVFSNNTESYKFYHQQNCCESVYIESIVGDLLALVGTPILMAEESSSDLSDNEGCEEWTFYKFATIKGYVDICWRGTSNGYYSTSVSLEHKVKQCLIKI